MDLMDCRNEIDKIDQQIVQLFEQRMDIAKKVAEYKKKYWQTGARSCKRATKNRVCHGIMLQ